MWKSLRIFILLIVLGTAIQQIWLDKADLDWKDNLYVAVYPINADAEDSETAKEVNTYISTLTRDDFEPVAAYFAEQSARYDLGLRRPIEVQLGDVVHEIPAAPPKNNSLLETIIWSLKFRYFAWKNSPKMSVKPDIKLYLLYHNPKTHPVLSHSTALNKGRIGRVNLFGDAKYAKKNLVILSHELLHTLTATDKYDLQTTLPIFPDGFAEPDKRPLYPQDFAELMGGRIPLSESRAEISASLAQTVIGHKTAQEIGWLRPAK
ncbi:MULTISPECIES: hypothetical protein [Methylotenera]|uniref:hypothetical protein n=1 Tax=Methylotenera TaxID=359407 RepID=UPI00039CDB8E|nr:MULTISPECIES: hypothetical protein [Methylotenera]